MPVYYSSTYEFDYRELEGHSLLYPSMTQQTDPGDYPTTICQTVYDENLTTPIAKGSFFMWYPPPPPGGDFPRYSAGQETSQYLYLLDSWGAPLGHLALSGQSPALVVYAYDSEGKLTALVNLDLFPKGISSSTQMRSLMLLQYDDLDRALSAIRIVDPYVDLYLFHYNARGYPDMIVDTSTAGEGNNEFFQYLINIFDFITICPIFLLTRVQRRNYVRF